MNPVRKTYFLPALALSLGLGLSLLLTQSPALAAPGKGAKAARAAKASNAAPKTTPDATPPTETTPPPSKPPEEYPTEVVKPKEKVEKVENVEKVTKVESTTEEVEGPKEEGAGYGKTRGLLGPVTLGPTITLISLPHLLQAGAEGKYKDRFGFGFLYGVVPKVTISSISVKMNNWDFTARWFPFRGAFFIGGSYGSQSLKAEKSTTITVSGIGIPTKAEIELTTPYFTPHLGWRWVWNSGFFMGLEMGWQLALSATTKVTTDPGESQFSANATALAEYQKLKADVEDKGNSYGKKGLPHLTLLQIGFLF